MGAKFRSRTSWREKLERPREPMIGAIPPRMARRLGPGTMLIPRPVDVDEVIRQTKPGELLTPGQIRETLARRFSADVTCPLTTGIFIRIAAEAAEEDRLGGRVDVTPYWRVVGSDGALNARFPGGAAEQARRLADEGHGIESRSGTRTPRVSRFEERLARL